MTINTECLKDEIIDSLINSDWCFMENDKLILHDDNEYEVVINVELLKIK